MSPVCASIDIIPLRRDKIELKSKTGYYLSAKTFCLGKHGTIDLYWRLTSSRASRNTTFPVFLTIPRIEVRGTESVAPVSGTTNHSRSRIYVLVNVLTSVHLEAGKIRHFKRCRLRRPMNARRDCHAPWTSGIRGKRSALDVSRRPRLVWRGKFHNRGGRSWKREKESGKPGSSSGDVTRRQRRSLRGVASPGESSCVVLSVLARIVHGTGAGQR